MEKRQDIVLEDGHIIPEEMRTRCEVWSRPVGYLRPVQHWNNGKKEEFRERKRFKVGEMRAD
jgi:ribonucleoside-triphosphate reductase